MSSINNPSNETQGAQPMKIGTTEGETSGLINEIGHSGVADSPAQVEQEGVLERDHDRNRAAETPTPIITSG